MGRLNLPSSGQIYVDAQVAIYSTGNHPLYASICAPVWQVSGDAIVVSSELTLLEILVTPFRNGDILLASQREGLWKQTNTRLIPITQELLREAARLRAIIPGLKTPDAIHAATALVHGSAMFLTNDIGIRRVPGLPLVLLDDVLAAP